MRKLRLDPILVVVHLVQGRRNRGADPVPGQSAFISHAPQSHVDCAVADRLTWVTPTRDQQFVAASHLVHLAHFLYRLPRQWHQIRRNLTIGRAAVLTPVTNDHLVCSLWSSKKI